MVESGRGGVVMTGVSAKPERGGEPNPIDAIMDQATSALAGIDYFAAVKFSLRALARARRENDFERMARVCLPLQEARRQIRQLATDTGRVIVITSSEDVPSPIVPGCYLLQPPMIGAEANWLRQSADRRKVPVYVLTREPFTKAGTWPIVGVGGQVSVRAYVEPPEPVTRDEKCVRKDDYSGCPSVEWFEAAGEALGDAAIAKLKPEDPALFRVDDLLEYLECAPEHEKLHQSLAEASRQAAGEPIPEEPRRRGIEDPYSF